MRKTPNMAVELYRLSDRKTPQCFSTTADGNNGFFIIPKKKAHEYYQVKVSDGGGWDHVSVTIRSRLSEAAFRTPTWDEMCFIKDIFFEAEERVMQLHPRESEYVNVHPNVLHLWKPQTMDIPGPPRIMV